MLLLDNLINNYLNIISCFIILSIFNLNKYKILIILLIDILLNKVPVITIFIIILYYLNKLIFSKTVNSNMNKFIFSCIYMLLFLSYIYFLNDYNYSYFYFFKSNIFSLILNIIIYYIYIFYTINDEKNGIGN